VVAELQAVKHAVEREAGELGVVEALSLVHLMEEVHSVLQEVEEVHVLAHQVVVGAPS
jgi:hypothetical protein